jgi:hypothetical protein
MPALPQVDDATPTLRGLVGASVLSAIGSLTQHLGPVIVIAVVADNRASLLEASWLITARAFGDLLAALVLPAIGVSHLGRFSALVAVALMLVAFSIANMNDLNVILCGFLIVGFCSGVLKYLGTMAASGYLNRTFAFVLRLSLVLVVAGATTIYLLLSGSFASYSALLNSLLILLLVLSLVGLALYRPVRHRKESSQGKPGHGRAKALVGLFVLCMFFIGISGFMAYLGERALARGLSTHDTILAIGVTKGLAGIAVLGIAYYLSATSVKRGGMIETCLLIAALWAIFLSRSIEEFFAGLLVLEIALNSYGGRLQSVIASVAPRFSGRWLNLVILLGSAVGPPLYGLAIASKHEMGFLAFSCLAVVLSLVWQRSVRI